MQIIHVDKYNQTVAVIIVCLSGKKKWKKDSKYYSTQL